MKIRKKHLFPWFYLSSALLLLTVFMFYPLVKSIFISFQHYLLYEPFNIKYVGLENLKNVIEDAVFWKVLKNSLVWVFFSILFQFILGFALALALKEYFKGRNIYQAIVFSPWAISGFLIAVIWKWMYNGQYGVINDILLKLGVINEKISFLASESLALPSVIVSNIWFGIPFFAIMLLAGLKGIPDIYYEATSLDGAGVIKKFFYITLPVLKPVIVVSLLLRAIWIFNFPDLIYIMTNGGPANASQTLATYIFYKAYKGLDFGYAGALSVYMIFILSTMFTSFFLMYKLKERYGKMA